MARDENCDAVPNLKDFVGLVEQMRMAQKAYFRYRKQHDLNNSRFLEIEVDRWVRTLSSNPTLFGNPGQS